MCTDNCLMKDQELIKAMEMLVSHLGEAHITSSLRQCARCENSMERQRVMLMQCQLESVQNVLQRILCEVSNIRRVATIEGTCHAATH